VERPEPLKDLLGYQFWVSNDTDNPRTLAIPKPHPEEFEYYQRLDDLARQLTDKLKELKKQAKPVTTPVPKNNIVATPRIFLATVTEDLEERRTEIIRYFDQQGIQFLPKKTYSIDKFQQTLDQDLNECRLFVQLLSEQFPPFFNYPLLQYQRALAANCPILQWRAPNLNISAVSNVEHQNLLEASTVIATGFNEFQTIILKHLKSEEEVKFETDDNLVFINATQEDMALAHKIKDFLDAHGIGYSLPLDISVSTTPAEIRQNLEQNLLYCDAVIVVYDKTSIAWVNEQLLYAGYQQATFKHQVTQYADIRLFFHQYLFIVFFAIFINMSDFPYPGLRPFQRHETDIFFGRDEHTDQLIEKLGQTHFIAVIGPSGCGKSSLVRTGLLAGLETGFLANAGTHWRIAEFRPGNRPFFHLAEALLAEKALGRAYTDPFTEHDEALGFLQADLRRGPFSLNEILQYTPLPEKSHLLLLVDQFEEIFRYYQQGGTGK